MPHPTWDSGVLFHNFPAMVYPRAPVKIKGQGLSGHILDFQMAQGPGIDPEPPEIVCEDQYAVSVQEPDGPLDQFDMIPLDFKVPLQLF